jgi:hypothetical protein
MGWWHGALLKLVNMARGYNPPPGEALELIRDLHQQKVEARQIAANLNMLKIQGPEDDIWTEDHVKAAVALLTVTT